LNNYCVYCHTTPSGKKYVGISCDPIKRWNSGKGYIGNFLFYRAIKKYGWENIKHEILFCNLSEEEAKKYEIKLINEWKLIDKKFGYNLQTGGGGPFSEETRIRMSESRKGNQNTKGHTLSSETKSKISQTLREYYLTHPNPNQGKHHSKEAIEKLKNREFSEETRKKMRSNHADFNGAKNPSAKKIIQYSLNGIYICEYDYAKLAAEKYNLDLSSIIKCCRHKSKTCGGFKWEYATKLTPNK